jgi:RecB family exonuclease
MKFYALVLWRTRGVVAAQLKLLYLKDGDALTYAPDEDELIRFERTLRPSGRRSSARWPPATSARTRPGSATGATTRRSAPPGAALPRRSRRGRRGRRLADPADRRDRLTTENSLPACDEER